MARMPHFTKQTTSIAEESRHRREELALRRVDDARPSSRLSKPCPARLPRRILYRANTYKRVGRLSAVPSPLSLMLVATTSQQTPFPRSWLTSDLRFLARLVAARYSL